MQELLCAKCIKDNFEKALKDRQQSAAPAHPAVTFVNGTALCDRHSREMWSR